MKTIVSIALTTLQSMDGLTVLLQACFKLSRRCKSILKARRTWQTPRKNLISTVEISEHVKVLAKADFNIWGTRSLGTEFSGWYFSEGSVYCWQGSFSKSSFLYVIEGLKICSVSHTFSRSRIYLTCPRPWLITIFISTNILEMHPLNKNKNPAINISMLM
jgi:hypothetical protein